ncbi:MAG: trehalose-6-phosphate synthase [Terracidiphilus sp.]
MRWNRIRLVALLVVGIALISAASTYFDVLAHKHTLRSDLVRRTQWFGAGLQPQIEQQFGTGNKIDWAGLLKRLRQHPDEPSLTILDTAGNVLASDGDTPAWDGQPGNLIKRTLSTGKEAGAFVRMPPAVTNPGGKQGAQDGAAQDRTSVRLWYEDAMPLHAGGNIAGALLMTADAEYIHAEGIDVWQRSFLRIAVIVVLVMVVMFLTVRWFVQQPVTRATEWLRRLRHGEAVVEEGAGEFDYLAPLAREVTSLAENLAQARVAAETEARLRDQAGNLWTADRLAVHARDRLGDGKLFVVSNREPYMHVRSKGKIECIVPPSGLVTAIEPILRACDGTWIAHGSGNEDGAFVDEHDRLRVPPDERRYTLRRVWLSPEEESGYYEGFSNEGLWPLCHIAHTRPIFRQSDWSLYQSVNEKFADVLLEEIRGTENPVIFVQDYHFALLPRMIKNARPDARVAIFWHIPWPNPESFSICPWQVELVNGLLGADVIGFHLQSHCNNFLETVDRTLEARTDWEHFSIRRNGHLSSVRPYPISVAWSDSDLLKCDDDGTATGNGGRMAKLQLAESPARKKEPGLMVPDNSWGVEPSPLHRELRIEGMQLVLGVDRMDYTKGIVERLLAIEQLLEEQPWYREQIVFVQIASPSRTGISTYADLRVQVEETVERINRAFQTTLWKPVILIQRQCSHDEVERYYRAAEVCLVTSLHDGMNLVAKEYVAARSDCDGVLVLSKFAGASQELRDALLVNPYDVAQVRDTIATALKMTQDERRLRMKRMRQQVKEHNVYRWASNILTDVCSVRIEDEVLAVAMNRPHRKRA